MTVAVGKGRFLTHVGEMESVTSRFFADVGSLDGRKYCHSVFHGYFTCMSVAELEKAVSLLPPQELSLFSQWFEEFVANGDLIGWP